MARKRIFGCLGVTALVVVVLGVLIVGGLLYAVQSPQLIERILGKDAAAGGGLKVVDMTSIVSGKLRVQVADEMWQGEVRKLFPITEDIAGMVKLHLRNPRFIADADPAWIRLTLELEAEVKGSGERFPGQAVLRTQIRFDRAKRTVFLKNAELVEFSFSGQAAALVGPLKGVLSEAISAELKDFALVEIPEGDGWLQKQGAGMVSDVTIEGGKVEIVVGR